jgi:hypothetical protein
MIKHCIGFKTHMFNQTFLNRLSLYPGAEMARAGKVETRAFQMGVESLALHYWSHEN